MKYIEPEIALVCILFIIVCFAAPGVGNLKFWICSLGFVIGQLLVVTRLAFRKTRSLMAIVINELFVILVLFPLLFS